MPQVTLDQLLKAPVVTRVVSTYQTPKSRFQTTYGLAPGSGSLEKITGRHFGWDTFNKTRAIARGRSPGVGPGTRTPQVQGHVSAIIYRAHEKMPLLAERIHATRPLGQPWGTVDASGQNYITRQEGIMAQLFKNNREYMVSRMFRGSFDLVQSGDDWNVVDSGGTFTINFQVPSTNKSQFAQAMGTDSTAGAIIDVSWADPSADVINHCNQMDAAFEILHGRPLRHVWINATVYNYLLNNIGLKDVAGIANIMWISNTSTREVDPADGTVRDTGREVVFKALPDVTFHVYNAVLDVNGTTTKFIDNTHAIFTPEPDGEWIGGAEGSEIVMENVMDNGTVRYGLHAWTERTTQPAGFELIGVDNFIPALFVPSCVGYGTVIF